MKLPSAPPRHPRGGRDGELPATTTNGELQCGQRGKR